MEAIKENTEGNTIVEISFEKVSAFFFKTWKAFIFTGFLCGITTYMLTFLMKNEYRAKAKILPEYSSSLTGNLTELASLAGIGTKNRTEAIRPDLYPEIVKSTPFLIRTLSTPMKDSSGKTVVLQEYLSKNFKVKPKPILFADYSGDSVMALSRSQQSLLNTLRNRINAGMAKTTGIITIEAEMPDPYLAAEVNSLAIRYIKEFVSDYRFNKEATKASYLGKQVSEAKAKLDRAETAFSAFKDTNRNLYTNIGKVQEQRLQAEFMRLQSVYAELSRQYELARLQAAQFNPVIEVLEPPVVPNATSKPRRLVLAVGAACLGIFICFLYFLIREIKGSRLFSR